MFGVPENCNRRWPSSFTSATVARIFVGLPFGIARMICVPMRAFLPGRSMAHQSFGAFSSSTRFQIAAAFGVYAAQPRRNHPRIVQHQHIASAQKFQQIAELPMFDVSVRRDAKPAAAIHPVWARAVARSIPAAGQNRNRRFASRASFKFQVGSFKPARRKIFRRFAGCLQIVNNFRINIDFGGFPLTDVG